MSELMDELMNLLNAVKRPIVVINTADEEIVKAALAQLPFDVVLPEVVEVSQTVAQGTAYVINPPNLEELLANVQWLPTPGK